MALHSPSSPRCADLHRRLHPKASAVGDWLFGHLGGLQLLQPSYKASRIAPLIGAGRLREARCSIQMPSGLIGYEWTLDDLELTLVVTVPVNTCAEVIIPTADPGALRDRDVPAASAPGVRNASFDHGRLTLVVGSGRYVFKAPEYGISTGSSL